MRPRLRMPLLALLAAGLAPGPPAHGAQVVTWEVPSAHVDLSKFDLGGSPPHRPKPPALRVNVFLPDGYDGKRDFPVLYLLHGHGEGYADWSDPAKGAVMETAKDFPGIIVMPEGWRGWYANWFNGGLRGNPAWERYHLDELIPLVHRRLRVRPGRRWHAIAGWSMGGQGAMFYASQRPGYFGAAASFSGTLSLERPDWPTAFETQGEDFEQVFAGQTFYVRGHNPTALVDNLRHTRLYATVGNGAPESGDDGDFAYNETYVMSHNNDFFLAATQAGLDITYRPRDGRHEFLYWRQHFRDAVAWGFFEPVTEDAAEWTYETVAQQGEMWCLRFQFARAPEVLETFRLAGGRLSGQGAGTATITTRDGRSFTAELPFEREVPAQPCSPPPAASRTRPKLRLTARPARVRVGQRTRLRFRAVYTVERRTTPAAGALIRFAGRRIRTDARGRATLIVRFRRPGVVRARVSGRSLRSDTFDVRVAPRRR